MSKAPKEQELLQFLDDHGGEYRPDRQYGASYEIAERMGITQVALLERVAQAGKRGRVQVIKVKGHHLKVFAYRLTAAGKQRLQQLREQDNLAVRSEGFAVLESIPLSVHLEFLAARIQTLEANFNTALRREAENERRHTAELSRALQRAEDAEEGRRKAEKTQARMKRLLT